MLQDASYAQHRDGEGVLKLLQQLEQAEENSMLCAVQDAAHALELHASGWQVVNAAAVVAAAEAAACAAAAAAQQQRLQLFLRLASLLGSCAKGMSVQLLHSLGWKWVASGCCLVADLCQQLAGCEQAMRRARQAAMNDAWMDLLEVWETGAICWSQQPLSDPCRALVLQLMQQHPYTHQLWRRVDTSNVWHAWQQHNGSLQEGAPAVDVGDAAAAAGEQVTGEQALLAALLAGLLYETESSYGGDDYGGGYDSSYDGGYDSYSDGGCDAIAEDNSSSAHSEKSGSSSSSSSRQDGQDGLAATTSSSEPPASSSSSSSRQLTTQDVEVACIAVAVRAMRLYGTVLEAALRHPCLRRSTTAEARRAGAAQLSQQLIVMRSACRIVPLPYTFEQRMTGPGAARLMGHLPRALQRRLDSGSTACLEDAAGAAAAIGALLFDMHVELQLAGGCTVWVSSQLTRWSNLESTEVPPAPQHVLGQLFGHTEHVGKLFGDALHLLAQLQQALPAPLVRCRSLSQEGNAENAGAAAAAAAGAGAGAGAAVASSSDNQQPPGATMEQQQQQDDDDSDADESSMWDPAALEADAVLRAAWVSAAAGCNHGNKGWRDVALGSDLLTWADAVATELPSRRCCSNPCCVSLREMSEWQMVWGSSCVCGGCAAGSGQAVRYCSRECQAAHWPMHKPLCSRLRRQHH
jgi:hypothetical protein